MKIPLLSCYNIIKCTKGEEFMPRDVKADIFKTVEDTVAEFREAEDVKTAFGKPRVGFVSTNHPLYDTLFARGVNDHPKNIYRPGYTVIVHYVPYEEGENAFFDAVKLTMAINGNIRRYLDKLGRLTSNTCIPIDWDCEQCREEWCSKYTAWMAGMGSFGPAGSFHVPGETDRGIAGTIITDGLYGEKPPEMTSEELESAFNEMMKDCRFKGTEGVECSDELIAACPAGAIDRDGIDRKKCQDYCEKINSHTPNPEVCGKCFNCR